MNLHRVGLSWSFVVEKIKNGWRLRLFDGLGFFVGAIDLFRWKRYASSLAFHQGGHGIRV